MVMQYRRMPIEIESPEQMGYANLDCNLTESSLTDVYFREINLDLRELALAYGDHSGKPDLRALIASESKDLNADDILMTPGAAAALFIVSTSLLKPQDHLLVVKPNYATNIETPRAIGARVDFLELKFEEGFTITRDLIASKLTADTKLVSLTFPHNPTGSTILLAELKKIVGLIESSNAYLLFDETYRKMAFHETLPPAASLSSKVISVSSLSKTYGLPGIRIGWLACLDPKLMNTFLAAKEQIVICNSVVDEEIAFRYLEHEQKKLISIHEKIRKHFTIMKQWIHSEKRIEWVEPSGGVVCFPRIRESAGIDVDQFYRTLNEKYGTFVGPGHWFEMDRRYMRIGYGWPREAELRRGLENISKSLSRAGGAPARG